MSKEDYLLARFINYIIRTTRSEEVKDYLRLHGVNIVRNFLEEVDR